MYILSESSIEIIRLFYIFRFLYFYSYITVNNHICPFVLFNYAFTFQLQFQFEFVLKFVFDMFSFSLKYIWYCILYLYFYCPFTQLSCHQDVVARFRYVCVWHVIHFVCTVIVYSGFIAEKVYRTYVFTLLIMRRPIRARYRERQTYNKSGCLSPTRRLHGFCRGKVW